MNKKIVKIRIIKSDQFLNIVKLVKTYTGLGLKEAKDIVDEARSEQNLIDLSRYTKVEIQPGMSTELFVKELNQFGTFDIIYNDVSLLREFKLYEIGIGDRECAIEFIKYNSLNNDTLSHIFEYSLGKLSNEQLSDVISELKSKLEW